MKEALENWSKCPQSSREAVLKELQTMATEWSSGSDSPETKEDAATLLAACRLLQAVPVEASTETLTRLYNFVRGSSGQV